MMEQQGYGAQGRPVFKVYRAPRKATSDPTTQVADLGQQIINTSTQTIWEQTSKGSWTFVASKLATGSAASANITLNGRNIQSTHTGLTTAAGASQVFVITNSAITATTQSVFVSADNLGANDAQMTITRVLLAVGSVTVTLKNNGAAALNGDVHINVCVQN